MKIVKATDTEKNAWRNAKELHPLYGYVMVSGHRCAVEYLGEGPGEPNYEAHAPQGMHFDDGLHTVLGTNQKDLFMQLSALEKCRRDC